MSRQPGDHPPPEQLPAFGLGLLAPDQTAALESHVAECEACCQALLAVPDDALVTRLREAVSHATLSAISSSPALEPADGLPTLPPELASHPRYRVEKLLGAGGMGAVYLAYDRIMERPVALKIINPGLMTRPAVVERFTREVKAAARLGHPNIVTALDAGQAGGTHFLVMEYVEGTDLGRLVQERGPLPVAHACDCVRQAALGLQHAFDQGMVHRDLKPHNLMRTPDGRVKVLDFGLARFASEAASAAGATRTGVVLGTVDYIAPEQADNAHQADIRSDIYSLGCTLYHLLAGRPPFPTGTPIQKVMGHMKKKPQPLTELRDDLPEELMPVLERMLAKNPRHRYQTPAEVASALERFTFATDVRRRRRSRIGIAAAVLLFLVTGMLGAAVYHIVTDKGELVIETDNDDVEVVVSKGGEVVKIIDTKSGKHVTLNSGEYELALKEGQEGLKLSPDKVTLKRGETVLATITRVTPKYLILPIDKVASAVSTKRLFSGPEPSSGGVERLIFPTWGKQEVFGIPFDVIDPQGESVKNAIVLYGPGSALVREMPTQVSLKCGSPAKAIHLLGGVAGWGWSGVDPDARKTVCVIVRLHYRDGGKEDHELINGVHFCDYPNVPGRRNDVPGSRLAIQLIPEGDIPRQMRYLAVHPKSPTKVIEEVEFIKGMKGDVTAPVIMAVTVEKP
jgi:serine/threonine protein kinase